MKPKKKIRVLIAEDDFLAAETVKQCLKKIGCEPAGTVFNGMEAVETAEKLRPDVILMDIEMPEISGLEAARRIRERSPVPIVVLTAHESPELIQEAAEAGVGAYLTKPPKPAELEKAVLIALARHADLTELRRLNREIEKAMSEIHILQGMLPFCPSCKRIRNDQGYWEKVENYLCRHSEADFSHGVCPGCMKKHYSEEYDEIYGDGDSGND